MKKSTLVSLTAVSLCVLVCHLETTAASPLFFDFLKRTFGGGKNQNSFHHNNQQGSQFQKQKKFPWDIFGIFGYKNVIRPSRPDYNRPNVRPTYGPPRPTYGPPRPTARPPYRPTTQRPNFSTTTWSSNCNCWTISSSPTGGPVIVASNAGPPPQPGPNVVIGRPPGAALPPSTTTTPRPPLVTTTTQSSYRGFNNGGNTENLGGGTFNPAQQFYPVNQGGLPSYVPPTNRRPSSPSVNSATAPSVTTQVPSLVDEEGDFAIIPNSNEDDDNDDAETTTLTIIPRQNRNQALDDDVIAQPEFAIDILEEPKAEPVNTLNSGWIPMLSVDKSIGTTPTPIQSSTKNPRIPKVLQWFDNPYFIQQDANYEDLEDQDLNEIMDDVKSQLDLNGVSIANHPEAFHKSLDNLATLAYATEALDYTSSTESDTGAWTSRKSIVLDDNDSESSSEPYESSTETNLGIWRLIVTPESNTRDPKSPNLGINETPIFYPSKPSTLATETPLLFQQTEKSNTENPTVFRAQKLIQESNFNAEDTERPVFKAVQKTVKSKEPSENSKGAPRKAKNHILKNLIEDKMKKSSSVTTTEAPKVSSQSLEDSIVQSKNQKTPLLLDEDKLKSIGFFQPITEAPLYNWIWTDVNEDDLRDPDMTTVGTGTASSALLSNDPFPTLEPGFDLLSDDWFQVKSKAKNQQLEQEPKSSTEDSTTINKAATDKFMLYYPISGTPFFSFHPKLEIASIVKK